MKSENRDQAELSITFVAGEVIKDLNFKYRGLDVPTDVLSFNLEDEGDDHLLGDIIIAPEVANKNAEEQDVTFVDELKLLVTHGILHLLGYGHELSSQALKMERREGELLGGFKGDTA